MNLSSAVMADQKRQREIMMYGLTENDLRMSVEESTTFRHSGPAMVAASMLSDVQEMTAFGQSGNDIRQALNRAKWVLFEYCDQRDRQAA